MKTDLTGYPKAHPAAGAVGIFSRIVAVADGFDAATTRRSYQTIPIEPDQVLREMWENPRRGYDRILVKALINLIGIYPVGTCVILDTFEVAIVVGAESGRRHCSTGRWCGSRSTQNGGAVPPPGRAREPRGPGRRRRFLRSIVKVTNPDRYGLVVGDYFV